MSRSFLGQNFLIDESVKQRIVDLFETDGLFGEIGPGEGAITDLLVKKYETFYFFEKDPRLFEKISKKHPQLTGILGDFSKWDYCLKGESVNGFSFIGNLPYEAGSHILKSVAIHSGQVNQFLFMLQKEVVERVCSSHGTSDFGSLSVLMQGQFVMEALDIVPPGAFRPAPKVQSQLMRGRVRTEGRHPLTSEFQKFVQSSFLQKRKTLRNTWKSWLRPEKIDDVFSRFEFLPTVRAEEIKVDLWPKLFDEVSK